MRYRPEVNSALMYAGSGIIIDDGGGLGVERVGRRTRIRRPRATTTWSLQLASEEWLGPASAAMAAAVQPYVAWMTRRPPAAEQAAAQAQSAAAAFETAFASVVPPPMIAANRAKLTQALQTNMFGQNNGGDRAVGSPVRAKCGPKTPRRCTATPGQSATATQVTAFTARSGDRQPGRGRHPGRHRQRQPGHHGPADCRALLTQTITHGCRSLSRTRSSQSTSPRSNSALTEIWFLLTGQTILPTNLGTLLDGYSQLRELLLQHRGSAVLQRWYGQLRYSDRQVGGVLGGAAPAAAAAVPKAVPGLGARASVAPAARWRPVWATEPTSDTWRFRPRGPAHRRQRRRCARRCRRSASPSPQASPGPETCSAACPSGAGAAGAGRGMGPRYGFKPTVMARPLPAG